MMKLLTGKTAIITGASRGIGRGIAKIFVAQGCNVAFTYSSNKEAAEYIAVASYRNYFNYKQTGQTTLELIHLPVTTTIVNRNRMLRVEDGLVHFLFEDNAKWRT